MKLIDAIKAEVPSLVKGDYDHVEIWGDSICATLSAWRSSDCRVSLSVDRLDSARLYLCYRPSPKERGVPGLVEHRFLTLIYQAASAMPELATETAVKISASLPLGRDELAAAVDRRWEIAEAVVQPTVEVEKEYGLPEGSLARSDSNTESWRDKPPML